MMTTRTLGSLRPDPHNRDIFDPLEGRDLEELADSIRANGIINPVTIRPDGTIIAGEQRYRAAEMAGLSEVPVVVLDVADEHVEVLRIEENLRRRTLKTSETARAIRRLYEIHGITERKGAGRPKEEIGDTVSPISDEPEPPSAPMTVADIAQQAGVTERTVRRLNRLADLIKPLMARLDAGTITQKMACGFAQLPPEEQEEIAAELEVRERERGLEIAALRDRAEASAAALEATKGAVETVRVQKDAEVAQSQEEVERLKAEQKKEVARIKAEEAAARKELEQANRQLKKELADYAAVEHWKRHDKMHATLQMLDKTMTLRPDECANAPKGLEALRSLLDNDRQTAMAGAVWLGEYARALGDRLGAGPGVGLVRVK